jgi:hypothetical protein
MIVWLGNILIRQDKSGYKFYTATWRMRLQLKRDNSNLIKKNLIKKKSTDMENVFHKILEKLCVVI